MTSLATGGTPTSLYLYFDEADVLIYVGVTSRGIKRQHEHNSDKAWWPFVGRQEVRHFPDRPSALEAERSLIVRHSPPFNHVHNTNHEQARSAYMSLRGMRTGSLTTAERRAVRKSLLLSKLATPLPGHGITLHSFASDAPALAGALDVAESLNAAVGTPQRSRSGRISDIRFVGGMLAIGLSGKYLPEDVYTARAVVSVISNRKPAGFCIRHILLNESDHMAERLRIPAKANPDGE